MKVQIKTDTDKCVGCLACMTACIAAHYSFEDEDAESFRSIRRLKDEKAGFQKNICISCTHCGGCINVCKSGAIFRDEETGLVLFDKALCTGCKSCAEVCPVSAISYDKEGKIKKCDGCVDRVRAGKAPACVSVCYMKAISI